MKKEQELRISISPKIVMLTIVSMLMFGSLYAAGSIEMTLVKGGTFKMGNTFEEVFEDELPVHDVTLNDFYIGTYELSQAEWKNVMGTNPSKFKADNEPVENISWFDAVDFCNKLSTKEGLTPCYTYGRNKSVTFNAAANGYRLPTEAEWEYAARGGVQSKNYVYAGSNNIEEVGWFKDNSGGTAHDTGVKRPNELGLYDMSGNVWEWCWDWYSNAYQSDKALNPQGTTIGTERCRRGGSWYQISKSARSSNRLGTPPHLSFPYVGVRIVRNAK